jgi:diguanylate cyclase (GGDEF)-like protein
MMDAPSILVVDDEESLLLTITELLQQLGYECASAGDAEKALEALADRQFDVVLADIRMPGMDGLQLLKQIKSGFLDVDVIMMTAYDMDYSYVDVIEAGATDFIVKPFRSDELQAKLQRILHERRLKHELYRHSIRDSLTGLFNRRYLYQKLDEEVGRAKRQKRELSLLILDVDRFKEYNDANGHLEGDAVLAELGEILGRSIRRNVDSTFRYGGDEFAVLLIEADLTQAKIAAERVRCEFADRSFDSCTLSLGVTCLGSDDTGEDLLRRADQAMYVAKRAGGNRVESA